MYNYRKLNELPVALNATVNMLVWMGIRVHAVWVTFTKLSKK